MLVNHWCLWAHVCGRRWKPLTSKYVMPPARDNLCSSWLVVVTWQGESSLTGWDLDRTILGKKISEEKNRLYNGLYYYIVLIMCRSSMSDSLKSIKRHCYLSSYSFRLHGSCLWGISVHVLVVPAWVSSGFPSFLPRTCWIGYAKLSHKCACVSVFVLVCAHTYGFGMYWVYSHITPGVPGIGSRSTAALTRMKCFDEWTNKHHAIKLYSLCCNTVLFHH